MEAGGTNALEMVARDLKSMGLYLAANLSFEGVRYERLHRKLSDAERATQDRLAAFWLEMGQAVEQAERITGASRLPNKTKGRIHKMGSIHFQMARGRFFQALLASLNTPHMLDAIRSDLAAGHAAIIQLTNTFAANAERAITEAEAQGEDLAKVEASAKDILIDFPRNRFPIHKIIAVRSKSKGKGKGMVITSQVALDDQNRPIVEQAAIDLRDALLAKVESISVPEGPLEQILRTFGAESVAEVTGRSRRLVPQPNGSTVLEDRTAEDAKADVAAFMNDQKQILVFSTAGATGATYSAALTCRNQRLRRHYVLQAGWRADLALQGMGRSHRSNQAQPPEYVLLTTDLWANQRMVSAVAKGMRDLGALTRGLRQAASQDFFTADDNLEDEFGQEAWVNFVMKMSGHQIPGLSIGQFEREACIKLRLPSGTLLKQMPPVRRFLNAMSAMSCDNQTLFGQHYREELQSLKLSAIEDGTYDRGIETITPDSLIKLEDTVIYRDPRTGGETRLLKMLRIDELKPVDYATARRKALSGSRARVVKSLMTGRIAVLSFPKGLASRMPSPQDKIEVITPTGSRIRTREEVVQERWTQVDMTTAESLWNAELVERGDDEEREFFVITGAMLPIWDKLPRDRSTVYRMETDEGEQVIGRLVSEGFVNKLIVRVDALTAGGLDVQSVDDALCKGAAVTLANSWVLQGRVGAYTKKLTVTLSMPFEDKANYAPMIRKAKLRDSIGALRTLAYLRLNTEDGARQSTLKHILKVAPAIGAATL